MQEFSYILDYDFNIYHVYEIYEYYQETFQHLPSWGMTFVLGLEKSSNILLLFLDIYKTLSVYTYLKFLKSFD